MYQIVGKTMFNEVRQVSIAVARQIFYSSALLSMLKVTSMK